MQWFIIFTVVGVGIALWWKTPDHSRVLEYNLNWAFVGLVIPLVVVDYILGGIRFRLFFDGTILPCVSLWNCMRSNWANCFMGAVTPFRTGGGPAQLYILWRCGVKISQSMLVSVITFIATLFFFLIASITVLYVFPEGLFGSQMEKLIRGGFIVFGVLSAALFSILLFPSIAENSVKFVFRLIPFSFGGLERLKDLSLGLLQKGTHRFTEDFARLRKEKKAVIAATFIITPVLFCNKFLIGYVIARVFLPDVPLGSIIGLQIIIYFLNYFAPTPGASGIEEVSSVWLLGHIIPQDILILFAILLRFSTTILAAFLGGIVIFLDLRKNIIKRPSLIKSGDGIL